MLHDGLGVLWYVLLAILWSGFVLLESFTSGVGMIFRSARSETEGRLLQYTVGPYWDGSEVWFVTAGGATFAAFPLIFAEMFSNLYIALFLLLFMLIIRAVCMELVYKDDNLTWQRGMAWGWVLSSYGLALLLGVRFTNLFLRAGTADVQDGSFLGLLNKPGIVGGLFFIAFYRTSGILWANLKAKGDVVDRKRHEALYTAVAMAAMAPILMLAFNWRSNLFSGAAFTAAPVLWLLPVVSVGLPVATVILLLRRRFGWAFVSNLSAVALFMITGFTGTFPYMVAGITLFEGMASLKTLQVMTIVVGIFLPMILAYQTWKFIRFRRAIEMSYFE